MMYKYKLARLEIEGFKKFEKKFILDLKSPSGDPINYFVISGENGCGKTTILEAIYLLLCGCESSYVKDKTLLSAEIKCAEGDFSVSRTKEHSKIINLLVEYHSEQITNLSKKTSKLDPLLSHEWLDRLNNYWRYFRDDGTHFVIDRCGEKEWDLFMSKGECLYSVDSMSSGEQAVIRLALPLVQTQFEGLLLIDSPERHLHPRWSGRIVRAIRNLAPNAQVIAATNSDDAWEDAKSWERRLLNN